MARNIELARLFYTIEANTAGFKRDLEGAERQLGRVTDFVKRHPVVALGALGTAALAAGVKASQMAAQFEQSMAEIGTLVDTTTVDMRALSEGVLDLFRSLPVKNIDDLTRGLYNVVSAGVPASEALDFLRVAAQASVGGVTDVNTAVDGLTSAVNAFANQGLTARDAADAFFVAVKAGKTTFAEISAGIGQTASLAASLGVSLDDLLANMVALTKGGLSTSQAFTSLRAILSNILKPTTEFRKEFPQLAEEFNVGALRAKGLTQFMQDLAVRLEGNTEAASKMFGSVEGLNAALALTANGGAAVRDVMDQMAGRAGASEEAFQKMQGTTENLHQVLRNQLTAALIDLGNNILPLVNRGLRTIVDLLEIFNGTVRQIETATAVTSVTNLARSLTTLSASVARGGENAERAAKAAEQASKQLIAAMSEVLTGSQGMVRSFDGVARAAQYQIGNRATRELLALRDGLLAAAQSGKLSGKALKDVERGLFAIYTELAKRKDVPPIVAPEEPATIQGAADATGTLAGKTGDLAGAHDRAARAAAVRERAERAALAAAEQAIASLTVATVTVVESVAPAERLAATWERNAAAIRSMAEAVERQQQATEDQNEEEEKREQKLRDQAQAIARIASGLLGAGQAAGLLTAETAATLQNVINIADSIAEMVISGGLNLSSLVGILGSAAGIISSLFGESPETKARKELVRRNNEVLAELVKVNGDLVRLSTPGARLGELQVALEHGLRAREGATVFNPVAFQRELFARGFGLSELDEIAKQLGITIRNPESGKLEFQAIRQLLLVLQDLDTAIPDTFAAQLENLRDLIKIGLIEPTQEFSATLQLLQRQGVGAPAIAQALEGINVFAAGGREAATKALQDLFVRLSRGELAKEQLGGLSRSEFESILEDLIRLLRSDAELRPVELGPLVPQGERPPLEVPSPETAQFYADTIRVEEQQLAILEGILANTAAFVPVSPPALPLFTAPATTASSGGRVGGGTITVTITNHFNGPTDAPAVEQAVADAVNRALGAALVYDDLRQGDTRLRLTS